MPDVSWILLTCASISRLYCLERELTCSTDVSAPAAKPACRGWDVRSAPKPRLSHRNAVSADRPVDREIPGVRKALEC